MPTILSYCAILSAASGLLFSARAVADPVTDAEESYSTIVLVSMTDCCVDNAYPEAEQALVEELSLLKIPVTRLLGLATDEASQRRELETLARRHNAAAAIRLSRPGSYGSADAALWITDRVTRKTVYRSIRIDNDLEQPHAIIIAVRTVETLRASLLEFRYDNLAKETKHKPPVSAEIKKMIYPENERRRCWLGLALAGGLALSPGGIGERGAFSFFGLVQPLDGLDLEVSLDWSPFGQTVETERARSRMDYLFFRGWIVYRFFEDKAIQPAIGVTSGIYFGRAEGRDPDGQPLETARTHVAYLGGCARVYAFTSDSISLFLDGAVGALIPEVAVYHGSTRAAELGHPLVEVRFGLELRLLNK